MTRRTRFAPSPTGPLHIGHAYSAWVAEDLARQVGGTFLLRIEDIDQSRARPNWEAQIYDDLGWLGLTWAPTVLRQSERLAIYNAALDELWARGALYPCTCTRRDIALAVSAPQEGSPILGPDGVIYPGTCRPDTPGAHAHDPRPRGVALRLDARMIPTETLRFREAGDRHGGDCTMTRSEFAQSIGDIVLARQGMGTSYHLSVVLDDASQDITHVTRGEDLFQATFIHVALQALLGLPTPLYHHHRLIRDDAGKRLAKRDDARAIASYRAAGLRPEDIQRLVGFSPSSVT